MNHRERVMTQNLIKELKFKTFFLNRKMLGLFLGLICLQGFFLVIFLTLRIWPMRPLLLSTIFLNSLLGVLKTNPTSSKIRCKNISHVRNTWAFNPVKMFRQSWTFDWVCHKYSIFSGNYIILGYVFKTY